MKPLRKTTHARNPLSSTMLASTSGDLDLPLNDVVLVFACSENFVPYLSVAIQSIIDNASPDRRYDIIVLTRDISPTSMITLTRQTKEDNVGIGFLDVDAALGEEAVRRAHGALPEFGEFRDERVGAFGFFVKRKFFGHFAVLLFRRGFTTFYKVVGRASQACGS